MEELSSKVIEFLSAGTRTGMLSEDPVELLDVATRIGGRYMGADRAEGFGRQDLGLCGRSSSASFGGGGSFRIA